MRSSYVATVTTHVEGEVQIWQDKLSNAKAKQKLASLTMCAKCAQASMPHNAYYDVETGIVSMQFVKDSIQSRKNREHVSTFEAKRLVQVTNERISVLREQWKLAIGHIHIHDLMSEDEAVYGLPGSDHRSLHDTVHLYGM